jgi:hypothetical protein
MIQSHPEEILILKPQPKQKIIEKKGNVKFYKIELG